MKTKILLFALLLNFTAMGQTQISELQKGLIFHWAGSEWNPTRDLVSGVNGTATATYNVLDRQGSGRRSLSFNGTSDYVAKSVPILAGTSYTIIIKYTEGGNAAAHLFEGTTISKPSLEGSNTDGYKFYVNNVAPINTGVFTIGVEYTIACIFNASTGVGELIVNGISKGTNSGQTNSVDFGTFYLMSRAGTIRFAKGSISMCRIFNYALTPTQIANYSRPEYPIEAVDRGAAGYKLNGVITNDAQFPYSTFSGGSETGFTAESNGTGTQGCSTPKVIPYVSGRSYRATFTSSAITGTAPLYRMAIDPVSVNVSGATAQTVVAGANTYTFTASETVTGVVTWYNNSTTTSYTISNFSVQSLVGCVLDLNAEGLSSATSGYWYDKTNSLTATNSGTNLVIPPASCLGATYFSGSAKIEYTGMNGLTGITTISAQIRPLALGGYLFTNTKVNLYLNASGYLTFSRDGLTYINSGAASIAINNTYNILITSSATGVTNMYINGVLSGTANQAAGTPASGTSWIIGSDNTNYFIGTIKDLMINGEILDLDRIKLINDKN